MYPLSVLCFQRFCMHIPARMTQANATGIVAMYQGKPTAGKVKKWCIIRKHSSLCLRRRRRSHTEKDVCKLTFQRGCFWKEEVYWFIALGRVYQGGRKALESNGGWEFTVQSFCVHMALPSSGWLYTFHLSLVKAVTLQAGNKGTAWKESTQ